MPLLAFDPEIRRVMCTTNAIESVKARILRAVKARGHFPRRAGRAQMRLLAIMSLDPTGAGRKPTMRWKPAPNALAAWPPDASSSSTRLTLLV
ncbi:transposase [Amycolatopsis sp. NPDC050768]|uniref:transposase n=1 Tax=Amycolatopsis sp. NPDC050768 TaxID=3154839 RepID=UPI0033DBD0A9